MIRNVMVSLLREAAKDEGCPAPTQSVQLNLKNRQHAIDQIGYGPPNPKEPNEDFWREKAKMWKIKDLKQVKTMRCGNCAAFDRTAKMLDCIEKGLGGKSADGYDTVSEGELGYCHMLKFKCAASRTCDAWVAKKG